MIASDELLSELNDELLTAQKSYNDFQKTWTAFFGMNGAQKFYLTNHISLLEGRRNNLEALLSWLINTCWQLPLAAIAEGIRQHNSITSPSKTLNVF